jgi:hypothetical protein
MVFIFETKAKASLKEYETLPNRFSSLCNLESIPITMKNHYRSYGKI